MSRLQLVNNWEAWKELCYSYDVNPYLNMEFGIDLGGGNSKDWEYVGTIPKKEED